MEALSYEDVLYILENFYNPNALNEILLKSSNLHLFRQYESAYPTRFLALRAIFSQAREILAQENADLAKVLDLRFWQALQLEETKRRFNFDTRQIQRLQQGAIQRLTDIIKEQEQRCQQSFPIECGDKAYDLQFRRAAISMNFGTYFSSLFESQDSYLNLNQQITVIPPTPVALFSPIGQLQYLLQQAQGPRILVITGLGGMGKTTLAVKLLKCALSTQIADIILGDSAKSQAVDVKTQAIHSFTAPFNDSRSFYQKIHTQLGLPTPPKSTNPEQFINAIQQKLHRNAYRAILVLDNFESLSQATISQLMETLKPLLNRDIRAIITARHLEWIPENTDMVLVKLEPLDDLPTIQRFITWHIQKYQTQILPLSTLASELNEERLATLQKISGGIPLVIQLLLSQIAYQSWAYLEKPMPMSRDILYFLYQQHWEDFQAMGHEGQLAQKLAHHLVKRQRQGQNTLLADINQWEQLVGASALNIIHILLKRFLFIQRDSVKGDFVTFPSFMDFVEQQI